jgi:hypothetical protein
LVVFGCWLSERYCISPSMKDIETPHTHVQIGTQP